MTAKFGDAGTLAESLKQFTGTIGENIVLRRYARFGGAGAVGAYVHHNGKVGTLVGARRHHRRGGPAARPHDRRARHGGRAHGRRWPSRATTCPPSWWSASVASSPSRRRRAASRRTSSRRWSAGRIDKYFKEVTLLDQPWVRDDSKTISELVKQAGPGVSIRRFARFQIGQE